MRNDSDYTPAVTVRSLDGSTIGLSSKDLRNAAIYAKRNALTLTTQRKPKEIGLSLTEENAIAALEGRKTQTRRIIQPQPSADIQSAYQDGDGNWIFWTDDPGEVFTKQRYPQGCGQGIQCPYGQKGDLLYLQEPTQVIEIEAQPFRTQKIQAIVRYRDGVELVKGITEQDYAKLKARKDCTKKASSRFMLKSFARHWFLNEGVKAEILQNISEEDAIAEGIELHNHQPKSLVWYKTYSADSPATFTHDPVFSFRTLWDSINAKRGYGWNVQPWWVWAISFKRIANAQ